MWAELIVGVAASIAASVTHPLDLTKVRLQTSEGKGMVSVIKHTVQTYGELSVGRDGGSEVLPTGIVTSTWAS